uniref:Uncharacterized protein n=1 Tax=Photinus pyralis TaxID=7054 RepID=A0A1Y1MLS6_PHOPY
MLSPIKHVALRSHYSFLEDYHISPPLPEIRRRTQYWRVWKTSQETEVQLPFPKGYHESAGDTLVFLNGNRATIYTGRFSVPPRPPQWYAFSHKTFSHQNPL